MFPDDMTKVIFGINAIRVPAWMVLQDTGGITSFIGATRTPIKDFWGLQAIHKLIVGELIIRPHIAVSSNECAGTGLEGFLHDPWMDDAWLRGVQMVGTKEKLLKVLRGGSV